MKLGIVGLPGSGKTTIFEALTHSVAEPGHKSEARIGTIRVPDKRVDILSSMYMPQKTIFAQIEYFLPATAGILKDKSSDQPAWTAVRDADALIHVIRNFSGYGLKAPTPLEDFQTFDQEMILTDLVTVEKRLERLEADQKRGKAISPEEHGLLQECRKALERETPLRRYPDLAAAPSLKGYAFVSAKPMLVLFNNDDENDTLPEIEGMADREKYALIKGKLEQELSQMSEDEAQDFLSEFNITASAMDRILQQSYELLGLISFFTVGQDEVRAWTITNGTSAVDAAGVIHTDFKKGFIRAEVVSYADLLAAGVYHEARKKGTVRLEGKTYIVQDGDIINFRFNV
ncbi:MAG: DUF933 domain-containing protein [Thermodesulfobacteriota bacterium]